MKILIIDDDQNLVQALELGFKLQWPECQVIAAVDGNQALEALPRENPDIVLLDIVMPGMDGFEVLRRMREVSDTPVIMLSVRGQEQDKVRALEMGADDYIAKPFGSQELMSRMKAVLRRAMGPLPDAAGPRLTCGDLTIEYASNTVSVRGRPVELTWMEYHLLCALARHPNQVQSHAAVLARAWGSEYRGDRDLLKVYIRRLREKIEEDPSRPRYILTDWGRGYKLAVP